MTEAVELIVRGALIGLGGAAVMDAWALVARRAFDVQGLDYALLGRWIGHFPRGRFVHDRIVAADPVPGERPLGWAAHYAIGITFALLLVAIWGVDWARSPTIGPALAVGLGTIVAPWFVSLRGESSSSTRSSGSRPSLTSRRRSSGYTRRPADIAQW